MADQCPLKFKYCTLLTKGYLPAPLIKFINAIRFFLKSYGDPNPVGFGLELQILFRVRTFPA
jgi:hypothetical protein